ncbi:hypothetical protein ACOMDM_15215 [Serratia plymuthica]|jgi:hypothetical protein|uniref:Uncharacterized protein n=1 Tax=Serratia plymuthica TaxID=82996 RepID=A0A2X4UU80_SERPL|nr:hypothetical protein [Serratia plymuthica]AHY07965.1 hypothetical protein sch_15820 [Serratia plymuthica]ANJ95398.1 hypothetical protein ADP72_21440 [Serratia plymuthica]ANJ99215.1 hypothetical protein ADP73_15110 [Serratia plymuthica]EKF63709.1 hypothetical protein B194_3179 [Serratia plymuthica A30]MBI6139964.1 hypothetical protein [Serratia plymuthica]
MSILQIKSLHNELTVYAPGVSGKWSGAIASANLNTARGESTVLNEKWLLSLAVLLVGLWLMGLLYEEDAMRMLAGK